MRRIASFAGLCRSGFTVIEVMLVVSIIGLLAVMAIPYMRKARMRSHDSAFVNDLRMLVDNVMEQIAITEGTYPADAPAGVEPPGVSEYMARRITWDAPTPIGGLWDWDRAVSRTEKVRGYYYAGLSVIGPKRTFAQMQTIDSLIDDGNLKTGNFRSHASGYVYISEE